MDSNDIENKTEARLLKKEDINILKLEEEKFVKRTIKYKDINQCHRKECLNNNFEWLKECCINQKGKGSRYRKYFWTGINVIANKTFLTADEEYLFINKFGRGIWSDNIIKAFPRDKQYIIIDEIAVTFGAFKF